MMHVIEFDSFLCLIYDLLCAFGDFPTLYEGFLVVIMTDIIYIIIIIITAT